MSAPGGTSTKEPTVRLAVDEPFPFLTASLVHGGHITLPADVWDGWAVLLFYRGRWCPYCRKQLALTCWLAWIRLSSAIWSR